MWWSPGTPSHSLPLVLQVMAISWFFRFLVRLSRCCLEAFLSSDFFKLYISINFWMSSSIGSDLEGFGLTVVKILRPEGRWRSQNLWQILSSPFCERWLRPHWYSFLLEIGLKTTILIWKTVKHLIKLLKIYRYLVRFNSNFGL